jgi:hypothetical protein
MFISTHLQNLKVDGKLLGHDGFLHFKPAFSSSCRSIFALQTID